MLSVIGFSGNRNQSLLLVPIGLIQKKCNSLQCELILNGLFLIAIQIKKIITKDID